MKKFIAILFIMFQASLLFAQKGKRDIYKGNQLYQEQKYKDAESSYRQSLKEDQSVEGSFNLGDALYKQKNFDGAAKQFSKIAAESKNKMVKAKAYHNLGNSLLQGKKLQESIDAYKKALLNAPKDDQTRYNLAYAQEMLKKQQQQQKNQDKNNQDKNKKDQNKKDQDKKDKQDQNKNQQNKDQDKQPQKNKEDQQKNQQQQKDKLSKEDAERMLDALNNEEQQTQDKLKNKKLKGAKVHIEKDW